MRTRICQLALFAALTFPGTGCQQDPGALIPVTGRVTFNGVPLNGGIIVYTPDASKGEHGPIAHSKIQPDGTYTLYTGEALGAHAGWYTITFQSLAPATSQPGQSYNASESTIPEKYRLAELSKISCKVNVNQPNSFDFDLK
jgi:hypothetical protein